jgi:fructose-bisphosphate aldolase, class I
MRVTRIVKKILDNYNTENIGVKSRLCQILMNGRLGGTGKMVILPVDQGFEHGPARSFAKNILAYDPSYHFKLAINAGLNAYAAPLGFLEASADQFVGQIPTILKLSNSNSLNPKNDEPDQAITASVKDALRLGCAAIGLTIYPGSGNAIMMMEEAREVILEAKSHGLAVVIWSYPRGGSLSKDGETAIDVCAYAAHIAALLGANIIKVKLPTSHIEQVEAKKIYESEKIPITLLRDRVRHIMQSCFNGKRLVVFSGGVAKAESEIISEIIEIREGGGSGSIIGRNSFQRPEAEGLSLLKSICSTIINS